VTSDQLARDYLVRARVRRRALNVMLEGESYADVVREAHELIELILKGTLRFVGVEPPKRHDVHPVLMHFIDRLPAEWQSAMRECERILSELSAQRGPAFYGDETQLIPASELFGQADARRAVELVDRLLGMYERLLEER
jgi:HEPN domain-containing protein